MPDEPLVRFAFHPIHFARRGDRVKPAIFSQAEGAGCSVQRAALATANELTTFVTDFLAGSEDRIWRGILTASCTDLRSVRRETDGRQAICIYDTAEKQNPAHAEFGWSDVGTEPGDSNERRAVLMRIFENGRLTSPDKFRDGEVYNSLRADLRTRGIPT